MRTATDALEFVAAASQAGITNGETPTVFGPYNSITWAQVVTMIMRALYNDPSVNLPPVPPGFSCTLGMFDRVHGPTMPHAEYLGLLGGLQGFGPDWDPWALANRGEVAQIRATVPAAGRDPAPAPSLRGSAGQ